MKCAIVPGGKAKLKHCMNMLVEVNIIIENMSATNLKKACVGNALKFVNGMMTGDSSGMKRIYQLFI